MSWLSGCIPFWISATFDTIDHQILLSCLKTALASPQPHSNGFSHVLWTKVSALLSTILLLFLSSHVWCSWNRIVLHALFSKYCATKRLLLHLSNNIQLQHYVHWHLLFFLLFFACTSPWNNYTSWLGVKHQLTYLHALLGTFAKRTDPNWNDLEKNHFILESSVQLCPQDTCWITQPLVTRSCKGAA